MKLGILYNIVDRPARGLEIDLLSDNDILSTVENVTHVLESEHEVIPVRIRKELFQSLIPNSFDFIFNLCEGIEGNVLGEAWVPAVLDILGIPYTGSDSLTLGLCLNKLKTKYLLIANNIPTPKYQMFYTTNQNLSSELKFPLIVKPAFEDASVGITSESVVKNKLELFKRVEFILTKYLQPALVEEFIDGRELNVAIIGNGSTLEVLPISEIIFDFDIDQPKIVSYEAKWVLNSDESQKTIGRCPAELPKELETGIKRLAIVAYNLTGCRDYARIDFRLRDNIPYVLEVNPNPGINLDSGFVRSATTAGMTYEDFIKRILSEACKRYKIPLSSNEKKNELVLTSNNLIAKPVKLHQIELLMKWFNDSEVNRYMDNPAEFFSKEIMVEKFFVQKQADIDLIVTDRESNKEIGFCSIYNINNTSQSAEISFLIGEKQFQCKGFGKEIAKMLLSLAFDKLGLDNIFARVTQSNVNSLKILENVGFSLIGTRHFKNSITGDNSCELLYEITQDKYMNHYLPTQIELSELKKLKI